MAAPAAAQGQRFLIDPEATQVTVNVGRSGLLAFAGHTHEIAAPAIAGEVWFDTTEIARSSVTIEFDAAALRVTGKGEPAEDVPEVQEVMLGERVLDVQQYPTIRFQSTRVTAGGQAGDVLDLRVAGELTLHGVTREVTLPIEVRVASDGLTAAGTVRVRQTDFGISPVTAGAGTVRVRDEVEIVFRIVARLSPG
jgi:polyisoprenoid-binding protein YceI